MKILFCNIAYMNSYTGNIEEDIPKNGGKFVELHKDCDEKYNFLNFNGKCYGSVEHKGNDINLKRFYPISDNEEYAEGIDVIWCARNNRGKTVIVGWYRNARVYREMHSLSVTPLTGIDHFYYTEAAAEDCYLLPEEDRTFEIGRAAENGQGRGFGRENYWYADSDFGKTEIVPKVLNYINSYKGLRINLQNEAFDAPENIDVRMTDEECDRGFNYYDQNEFMKFLPYGYRAFQETKAADNAFWLATAMREVHQYDRALEWYKRTVEIEGPAWDTLGAMAYVYLQLGNNGEAKETAMKLLDFEEAEKTAVRCEIYGVLADANAFEENYDEAVKWLDEIIKISEDEDELEFVKKYKSSLEESKAGLKN